MIILDVNGAFLNIGASTRQDPSTGGYSAPDVIVVHESPQKLCDWSPCDSLSFDHRSVTITANLPVEHLKGQKRLVWDWKKGNRPVFTNEVEDQIPQECEKRQMKVNEMYSSMSAILLKAAQNHIGQKAVVMAKRGWMTKENNDK